MSSQVADASPADIALYHSAPSICGDEGIVYGSNDMDFRSSPFLKENLLSWRKPSLWRFDFDEVRLPVPARDDVGEPATDCVHEDDLMAGPS